MTLNHSCPSGGSGVELRPYGTEGMARILSVDGWRLRLGAGMGGCTPARRGGQGKF